MKRNFRNKLKHKQEVSLYHKAKGAGSVLLCTLWAGCVLIIVFAMFNLKQGGNHALDCPSELGGKLTFPWTDGFEGFIEKLIRLAIPRKTISPSFLWKTHTEPVLLIGETGTGKTSIAEYIHSHSDRCDKPFVVFNCAQSTPTLVESELFGHERGAFTSAYELRKGKVELADGGTLFIDELQDLPPELQGRFLRVVEKYEFERLGGNTIHHIDIRVIAAIKTDPWLLMKRGKLRDDLYHRLSVLELYLPPLRDYKELIPQLTEILIYDVCQRIGYSRGKISKSAMKKLLRYDFPGNIRELEKLIRRALIFAQGNTIKPEHIVLPKSYTIAEIVSREVYNATQFWTPQVF